MKTSTDKTRVVGKETYLNQSTGELVEMNVIESKATDFNFEKIWFSHILQALDCLGSKKIKVVTWLLENKDNKNRIIATQRKVSESCGVSLQTVADVIKILTKADVIRMEQQGVYILNPDVVFKGSNHQRMNILIKYKNL
ncbi:replication/maintenance protein [Vibrio genomosp. F6]|uniref:replication/maintenance protein RepL n=1 Tax=Vibrio genomosp. F6 TaxID=723172 RepID=UPI0010BD758C|nr:replication/maintenance protein RepL [Vibrio genomosp. F6]TKF18582.1 replication/maintenance protein [Vibrio genomosp. F6]